MSLGSRILHRGRAALSANLASTPREPLLFLYPQWIRKSSTTAPAASSQDGERTVPFIPPNLPRNPLFPDVASVNDATSFEHRFDVPKVQEPSEAPLDPDDTATTNHSAQAMLASTADLTDILPREPSEVQKTSVVERQVRKVLSMAKNLEEGEIANRRTRKAFQEWKREQLRSWLPDWRVILADLVKHTPQHGKWLNKALEVVIPLESLPQLLHGIDDYIVEIGSRYGCSVELGNRDEDTKEYRRFIISGPVTAISKTTADVLQIAPDVEMKTAPGLISSTTEDLTVETTSWAEKSITISEQDEKGELIRNVVYAPRTRKLKVPSEKIPGPKTWDHVSFLDYIRILTASSVPNHFNRFVFKMGQDHSAAVSEILRGLFKDPECKHAISRTACNEAMQYFVRVNRIEDVRVLFVRMEMLNLPLVPETFNIMLRGTAKSEDLHNFHFILHLMLRRGFTPNGPTWLAFMSAHPNIRVKLHILMAMKEKGLTAHPSILKGVCGELVGPEIDVSLEQSLSQDEFVAHMDTRYGKDWLSLESANRALHSFGARGLISRCWEFLNLMESRFIQADNYSINTILHHCKQATNLTGAVELLRSLPITANFMPDDETYRILFELAWRSRSYNLARVIWRYACLSAATTYRMRRRVLTSIMCATVGGIGSSPRERWKQFAGPVIFGANHKGAHPMQLLANTRLDGDAPKPETPSGETNSEDHEFSEGFSNPADTEVPYVGMSRLDAAELEQSFEEIGRKYRGNLERPLKDADTAATNLVSMKANTGDPESNHVDASEAQTAENADKGAEDEQNPAADTHSAINRFEITEVQDPDVGAAKEATSRKTSNVGASDTQTVETGGTNGEIEETELIDAQSGTRQFVARAIHNDDDLANDPKEDLHQMTQELWKQAIRDVKATLSDDYEVFKEWKPVKPFAEMLVEALERDTEWRRNGDYAEKDMHSLIRNAISVMVTSKRGKSNGGVGFYVWK